LSTNYQNKLTAILIIYQQGNLLDP